MCVLLLCVIQADPNTQDLHQVSCNNVLVGYLFDDALYIM